MTASILTPEQQEHVERLAASVDLEQAIWLSGYFAGLGHRGRTAPAEEAPPEVAAGTRTLSILFASETGNGKELARSLADAAGARGLDARVADMADYKTRALKDEQDLLVIASTHGEGDPPQTAVGFFEYLEGRRAPQLPGVRFAVLGLGDSTYEHFCGAGAAGRRAPRAARGRAPRRPRRVRRRLRGGRGGVGRRTSSSGSPRPAARRRRRSSRRRRATASRPRRRPRRSPRSTRSGLPSWRTSS